jgi:hypothetical protein
LARFHLLERRLYLGARRDQMKLIRLNRDRGALLLLTALMNQRR